jgi:putative heme-binding domain-containing protein
VARPEALGAIYRVQKRGAAGPADPRGLKLDWRSMDAAALVRLLDDSRPAVRRRAVALLARGADSSMDAIESALSGGASVEARRNAVWASSRAGGARGRAAVRAALKDESSSVRQAALHAAGLERDREAFESFVASLSDSSEALQRVAATALGRLGDARAVPALLGAAARPRDRAGEHAIIYALIEIGDRAAVSEGLSAASPHARRAALIALDQMDGGGVQAKDVAPLLGDAEPALRETAAWIAGFHPEWGKELAGQFGARLAVEIPEPERDAFASQLAGFARGDAARDLLAAALGDPSTPAANRLVVLQAMARAALREAPAPWLAAWARALEGASAETAAEVVRAARALPWPKDGAADLAAALERQGRDASKSASLRLESLAALPAGLAAADEATLEFLIAALDAERPPLERAAAASVLARTPLGEVELRRLAAALEGAGPLELGRLLMAFERSPSGAVGAALLSALEKARGLSSLRAPELAALLSKFPAAVQERGKALLAQLQVDAAEKEARLDALLAQTSKGDARRGLIVFKGPKAACVTCHAIGYVGGKAGPDLSKIGAIRTERDLLESILFPSASFVRSYEPVVLTTKDGRVLAGVLKSDSAEWFTVVIAADNEVRVERSAIADLKAGEASIMPQGLEEQLTVEELMDLVAFMRSMK